MQTESWTIRAEIELYLIYEWRPSWSVRKFLGLQVGPRDTLSVLELVCDNAIFDADASKATTTNPASGAAARRAGSIIPATQFRDAAQVRAFSGGFLATLTT